MPPERAVAAVGHLVMEDQEVADLGRVQILLIVILRDVARADAPRRQHADKAQQRSLDQVDRGRFQRSEEHTSELQSLMRISYAVFCLKTKTHFSKKQNNKRVITRHY